MKKFFFCWGAKSVIGLDLSEAQLAFAQKLAIQHGANVQFRQGNIEDLSGFNEKSFDL